MEELIEGFRGMYRFFIIIGVKVEEMIIEVGRWVVWCWEFGEFNFFFKCVYFFI